MIVATSAAPDVLAPPTDAELVRAARVGDQAALLTLLGRYEDSVAAACRRYVRGADVADATQEAFARAIDRLDNLREPAAFGVWIRAIARNVARDLSAEGGRLIRLPDSFDRASVEPTPEVRVLATEQARDLYDRLADLSERDARALWMRDAIGLDVHEVADELGLTEGSARVMLARARRRLRESFAGIAAVVGAWRVGLHERIGQHAPLLHPGWAAALQAGAVAAVLAVPTPGLTPAIDLDREPAPAVAPSQGSTVPAAPDRPARQAPAEAATAPRVGEAAPAVSDEPALPPGTRAGPVEVGGPPPEQAEPVQAQVGAGEDQITIQVFPGNLGDVLPPVGLVEGSG
ncbi:MAG TPA: sigma-70 family RNA polymerase sigma factor [Nitriliruptorales bacterium]